MPPILNSIRARPDSPRSRRLQFIAMLLVSFVLLYSPLAALIRLSYYDRRYTYIFLVPPLTVWLLWRAEEEIFAKLRSGLKAGLPFIALGAAVVGAMMHRDFWLADVDTLSAAIFGAVLAWTGLFIVCFGARAARAALFPLAFFFLIIPPPADLLALVTVFLQKLSADLSYVIFEFVRVPVLRNGFVFSLPGVDIEVAEECSGVGSSISLLISGILASHLFLQSNWSKLVLILLTIPIAVFRNAVRIVVISWLGVYVDPAFFYGSLHEHGATPASLLGLAIMVGALVLLRKWEDRSRRAVPAPPARTDEARA